MDAELGGEFIETASWLVLLKSRSMLPSEANEPLRRTSCAGRSSTTPHSERPQISSAADTTATYIRPRRRPSCRPQGFDSAASLDEAPTVVDVLARAREAVAVARAAASFGLKDVHGPQSSSSFAGSERSWRSFLSTRHQHGQWFADQPSDGARCALLLALLELTRRGFVLINQATRPRRSASRLCAKCRRRPGRGTAFALTA